MVRTIRGWTTLSALLLVFAGSGGATAQEAPYAQQQTVTTLRVAWAYPPGHVADLAMKYWIDQVEKNKAANLKVISYPNAQLYDDALAPAGIGINQFSILATLAGAGPSRIADLAARLVMDRSTLGHLIRPLEERGLVALRVDADDRRARKLSLTRAGRALLAKARPLWAQAQRRFERAFGAGASAELRDVLREVAALEF